MYIHKFLPTLVVNISSHTVESFSFFSITYPVIGAPPSCFGSDHDKSTLSTSPSVIFGVPGLPGISIKKNYF